MFGLSGCALWRSVLENNDLTHLLIWVLLRRVPLTTLWLYLHGSGRFPQHELTLHVQMAVVENSAP